MEVTKWYCDRCGKEVSVHGKLNPIYVSFGKHNDDYKSESVEFCDECFSKAKSYITRNIRRKESR